MREFDYSFIENKEYCHQFDARLSHIRESQNKMHRYIKNDNKHGSDLKKKAFYESIKCSNNIEGIYPNSDGNYIPLINGEVEPKNFDEMQIVGLSNAQKFMYENEDLLFFNEKSVLTLHNEILRDSGVNYSGIYKPRDNYIGSYNEDGSITVIFRTMPAFETPEAMNRLYSAFQIAWDNPNIDKLLLIPCVILDFLCIHPFLDGNGRMSRLLTNLLLSKIDIDIQKYISLDRIIYSSQASYYKALNECSASWQEGESQYEPFINEFLTELDECYKELFNELSL